MDALLSLSPVSVVAPLKPFVGMVAPLTDLQLSCNPFSFPEVLVHLTPAAGSRRMNKALPVPGYLFVLKDAPM